MGEIDETFGVLYLGTAIALIMFGITILQTYFYYLYYGHDGRKLKLLDRKVMSVWLLDTIHTAFSG
ncbi:hypothetical protein PILCRDRAFT_825763 [Piloderma croceum F 1598]|uniref:Uncharacterized protein n=1 Tax=Piloderma croceum (strain F 1598) TaxID=765440 RepID=A0A0C3AST6_PILCF|nr:hypothetical protein PILCRDRAFT_825763 [Piloderma croceum F 1598]